MCWGVGVKEGVGVQGKGVRALMDTGWGTFWHSVIINASPVHLACNAISPDPLWTGWEHRNEWQESPLEIFGQNIQNKKHR